WKPVNTGLLNRQFFSLAVSGDNIFAGTYGGGVFLSTNNGADWTAVNAGLTGVFVSSFAVCNGTIYAGTNGDGVFRSTNNGASWTAVNSGGLTNSYGNVTSLVASGDNIFAGTTSQNAFATDSTLPKGTDGGGMFVSTNKGTSWSAINAGLTDSTIQTLALSGGNIFAGVWGRGVFLSTNNGASWTAVNSGLTGRTIQSLIVSGNNIYAGIWGCGVFLSSNNGSTWQAVNSGLGNNYVQSLAVSDNAIFAGTYGGAVWRRPVTEMTGVIIDKPNSGAMEQVTIKIQAPGMARKNMTANFALPHSDLVSIKIYNLSGREIVSLVNRHLEAGPHGFLWNTGEVAPGCYMAQMQIGPNAYAKSFTVFK
ncbi:MAG: hypothetical protein PHC61_17920, partial [Chitinivibrionales bacterium]|nr:hypothetical protein [Chitinivibrionales bacterium]